MSFQKQIMEPFLTFLDQCDLLRPACSRCRRLGLRCEYLKPPQGQVFINRSVTNPFVKAVDIFSKADRTKLPENSGPKSATRPGAPHNENLDLSIPNSPDPEPVYMMQLLAKFIDIYFPNAAQSPSRVCQSPASWAHVLPYITRSNSAYNTSLAALCMAQLGIWNRDSVLRKESSRLYGSALGELRKTIGSISSYKLDAPEATLASIVILSTYEVSLIAAEVNRI
jgi:hypothetical protein